MMRVEQLAYVHGKPRYRIVSGHHDHTWGDGEFVVQKRNWVGWWQTLSPKAFCSLDAAKASIESAANATGMEAFVRWGYPGSAG